MSVPPTIQQGAQGAEVAWLQYCLTRITLEYQEIDGVFGGHTADAVREFQHAEKLTADGVVGPVTWGRLRGGDAPPPTLRTGSHGHVVELLQKTLNTGRGEITAPGTPVLVVDGQFGAKTETAVKAAQKTGRIAEDGVVGLQTWALPLFAAGTVLANPCGVRPPGETA